MKKKIALLGNMNNSFNALIRYLLDLGYEAKLFTFDYETAPHFHPSADCFDDRWKDYTIPLSWGNANTYTKVSKGELSAVLDDFDFIIGSGYAPAFVKKAGRTLDLFAPHGSDINHLPHLLGYSIKDIVRYLLVGTQQRKGIKEAKHIFSDRWTEGLEQRIARLGLSGQRHYTIIPFIYLPQYKDLSLEDSFLLRIKEIRKNSDLIIFHHIRHSWVNPRDKIAMKSNNILFEGVHDFRKAYPEIRVSIVTFEYGDDVVRTKNLIQELGIEGVVHWFDITPRKQIMKMMNYADVVTGEFHWSFVTYGAILEGMVMSKPIMHKRDDSLYAKTHSDLYPMIHVESSNDIFEGIKDVVANPEKYREMGIQSHVWMKRNMIDNPMKELTELLNSEATLIRR